MHLILLVVGLLVTAAGLVTIGFGIPINAFSLGNTLIVAGTTAVAGGLLLVGLSVAVRQLQRIAEALTARSAPRVSRAVENTEGLAPPTARVSPVPGRTQPSAPTMPPMPPRPAESRDLRPPEPRPEPRVPAPSPQAEAPGPLDWLRPKRAASAVEPPPMMEVSDEAPLSPPTPPRPAFPPPPASEPEFEPKAFAGGRGSAESVPRPDMSHPDFRPMPRATPVERSSARAKEGGLFDVLWPDSRAPQSAEPAPRDPKLDMPPLPPPAPMAARIREEAREQEQQRRRDMPPPPPAAAPPAERSPAILKSGVIDGMAYTLYADGSIEAELPQGTVKFASVDALRAHLEKNS